MESRPLARIPMATALLVALATAGCGENPAADVPKAAVGTPKLPPYPTDAKPIPDVPKPAEPSKDGVKDAAKDQPKAASTEPTAATATATAPAVALAIDPATSKVEFVGSKKIGGAHNGGFKAFHGTAELVPGKPELKSIAVDIDTTSIFSDDPKLTGHLKNKDFFEVEKYPTASFVTTEIKPGGEKGATHTLVGNLSLHGVTKSITIPVVAKVEPGGLSLTSEFALDKDQFGMTFSAGGVIRPDVVIKLDVKAGKGG